MFSYIEEFYAAYLGGDPISFRSLEHPEIFGSRDYLDWRGEEDSFFPELPASLRASIARVEAEQGAFHPTPYTQVTVRGTKFPNCVEESFKNLIFFMMRQRPDGLVSYDPSVFPVDSPLRRFMDRWGVAGISNPSILRDEWAALLAERTGVSYKKRDRYEIRSGVISGLNVLRFLLGVGGDPLTFDTFEEALPDLITDLQGVLPHGVRLMPEETDSMQKNRVTREYYGGFEVENPLGEKAKWKLLSGYGVLRISLAGARESWADELLAGDLSPEHARRVSPLILTPKHFRDVAKKLETAEDKLELYKTVDHKNPELIGEIIADIASAALEGDFRNFRFLETVSLLIRRLDDDHANQLIYEALSPVIISPTISDIDKEFLIHQFPFLLTGLGSKVENPILEWACENEKREWFKLQGYESGSRFLRLNEDIIATYAPFLAENVGNLSVNNAILGFAQNKEATEADVEAVVTSLPPTIDYLSMYGRFSLCRRVIRNISAEKLEYIYISCFNLEEVTLAEKQELINEIAERTKSNRGLRLTLGSDMLNEEEAEAIARPLRARGINTDRWHLG